MTKREWDKADLPNCDPARVLDVDREYTRPEKWIPQAERERKRREKAAREKAEEEQLEQEKLLKKVQWLRARAARGEELNVFERTLIAGGDKTKRKLS